MLLTIWKTVAVTRWLAATPSRLVAIAIGDVLGLSEQINVPGTTANHSNWRKRLPVSLEDAEFTSALSKIGEAVRR